MHYQVWFRILCSLRITYGILLSSFFLVSATNNIVKLNYDVPSYTLIYLRSPNFLTETEKAMTDDTTTCVLTASSNDVFTAREFRVTVFRGNEGGDSGQFDVYAVTETGQEITHRLSPGDRSVNYTEFLGERLSCLDITFLPGDDDLSFLLSLQGK